MCDVMSCELGEKYVTLLTLMFVSWRRKRISDVQRHELRLGGKRAFDM
jgi:hypothetical protein